MGVRGSVLVGTVTAVIFSHAATSPAFAACDTNNSVFDDDFEFMDPALIALLQSELAAHLEL